MLERTTKFTGERCEVGRLWNEPEPNLPNNNRSALRQLYSLEQIYQRDPKRSFGKDWCLSHHPLLNSKKRGKLRRACNVASGYTEVCLYDNPLAGPDLLYGFIGRKFRLGEGPRALTADIESMFS